MEITFTPSSAKRIKIIINIARVEKEGWGHKYRN